MKISVRTLKGDCFKIEVQPEDSVADVKKNIERVLGVTVYPAAQQVLILIHKGIVLEDDTTVEANNVSEESIIGVIKRKPASTGTSTSSTSLQSQDHSTHPSSAATETPRLSTLIPVTPTEPDRDDDASHMNYESISESNIQLILEIVRGAWSRKLVTDALCLAYNDVDKALDYLYFDLPAQIEGPSVTFTTEDTQDQTQEPEAQEKADQEWTLDSLRHTPQLEYIRAMVQSDPSILKDSLDLLEEQNQPLVQFIRDNKAAFIRLLLEQPQEPNNGGEYVSTEAESEPVAVADAATSEETLDRSVAEKEEAEIQKQQMGIDMTRLTFEEIPNRELLSGLYDNQRVTIKLLPARFDFRTLCQLFDHSRNLEHKNVGKVLGIGTTRLKQHFLVMEYLPLPTVSDFLHVEKRSFEFEDLLKVATETAEAMQYLHEKNIFYGGLETKGLLRNEEGVVKICGLSHDVRDGGRINWDLERVKEDVWDFGLVLWELLTGEDPVEAMRRHIKQKIRDGFVRTWKEDPPSRLEILQSTTDLLLELVPSDAHPSLVGTLKRCLDNYDQIKFEAIADSLKMITKEKDKGKKRSRVMLPFF